MHSRPLNYNYIHFQSLNPVLSSPLRSTVQVSSFYLHCQYCYITHRLKIISSRLFPRQPLLTSYPNWSHTHLHRAITPCYCAQHRARSYFLSHTHMFVYIVHCSIQTLMVRKPACMGISTIILYHYIHNEKVVHYNNLTYIKILNKVQGEL